MNDPNLVPEGTGASPTALAIPISSFRLHPSIRDSFSLAFRVGF
jgi:hypothetical protein